MTFHIRVSAIALVIAAAVSGASAEQAVDFSGNWTAAAPATTNPPRGDMGSGWGTPVTISQNGGELIVQEPIFSRYDLQPPLRFVYKLDGSESRNTTMAGHAPQTRVSRATWEGQALVIVTSYPGVDPATAKPFTTTVTQRLSLTSPTELVIETVRGAALTGRETRSRTVYKKT